MKGDNSPSIRKDDLESFPYPIPPLPEQQRIVDRIERLFGKLDEAKEKALAVVDGLEDRKATILHKAFTGELTAGWREKNQIGLDSWHATTVGECSFLITKGASPRWQGVTYTDDKTQTLFVTSENVREGFLDWTKEKYLDNKINEIQKRSVLQRGDVLVNIVGASIGRSALFDRDCLANTNQAVCIVRVNDTLLNQYLCYYFNSPFALWYYNDNKVETARANISLTNISDMPIRLPSLIEQREIVNQLDALIEREVTINTKAEQAISQIDTTKKAILTRAFRGELGTNDPNDESAEELLKQVLSVDTSSPRRAKQTTVPKELSKSLRNDLEKRIIKLFFQKQTDVLPVKDIMGVSSKTFDVLDCLRNLQDRQIISRQENGNYILMG